ncbi:MAG: alcohol dehydrogenase catalytic domain-containing protein [Streptosporangiales bacterium]|nr:alcohol dehydrogenase catalytic domain-containing protein [Streptosporangiales bacterium]
MRRADRRGDHGVPAQHHGLRGARAVPTPATRRRDRPRSPHRIETFRRTAGTMRALVFHGRGDLRLEDRSVPTPAAGELLLEVHAVGVCGTDAHEFASGPHLVPLASRHEVTGHVGPLIPGHELTGRVVDAGAGVVGFRAGTVVACGAGISCGTCDRCLAGRTNLCRRYATVGLQRHGGLAQYCAVPAEICLDADGYGLSEDLAALAQPMSIAVHAFRRGQARPDVPVAVVGVGGIGAFLTFTAAERGEVTVVDLDPGRLDVASGLGATTVCRPGESAALGPVFPVVFEVTGTAGGLTTALDLLAPGGRLVLVGLHDTHRPVDLTRASLRELELVGTNAHVVTADLPESLRLLGTRRTSWADIAPTALSLDRVVDDALRPMIDGGSRVIKALVDPWADAPARRDWRRSDQPGVGGVPRRAADQSSGKKNAFDVGGVGLCTSSQRTGSVPSLTKPCVEFTPVHTMSPARTHTRSPSSVPIASPASRK